MDKHRIRMTQLPDDPIPVLWIEIELDTWVDVSINVDSDTDLHAELHKMFDGILDPEIEKSIPLTYHTRAFNLYSQLRDYEESIIS